MSKSVECEDKSSKMNYYYGMAVGHDMEKPRTVLTAHDYGVCLGCGRTMVDGSRDSGEEAHCKMRLEGRDLRDKKKDYRKNDLAVLPVHRSRLVRHNPLFLHNRFGRQSLGHHEVAWAPRYWQRLQDDCAPTLIMEPQLVPAQLVIRERKSLCRMVHLAEDENLRYGILLVVMVPSVHWTRRQVWSHSGIHHEMQVETVCDKPLVCAVVRLEVATRPFAGMIARGSSSLELEVVLDYHGR